MSVPSRDQRSEVVQLSVTVDDQHLEAVEDVARALREQGMHVEHVADGLGVITGSAPASARSSLTGVDGVCSVDEQVRHQLPPPDSPVQ